MDDPRTVRPALPRRVLFSAVAMGLAVFALIVYAVWQSSREIESARMTGTVVKKEFQPQPEEQITLGRDGAVASRHREGDYILTVEVPQPGGAKKPYYVWVSAQDYQRIKVGDSFDVGPALAPK